MNYKKHIFGVAAFLAIILIPKAFASAAVQINEIAWMGTAASANAEWIELYNPDSTATDLTGWKLSATDGSPNISLSGTIAANGYFLLERTSDATLPSITANQIYTGALSNSGEHLQLLDSTGAVVDDVDASGGWPAGDDASKNTMQRSGSSWITAAPTPDAQNATTDIPAASQTTNSNSSSQTTSAQTSADDSDGDSPNQVDATAKSMTEIPVKPDPTFTASAAIPDYGTAGVAVSMSVSVHDNGHRDMVSGKFIWSYGDGSSDTFITNTPPSHIYYYSGTYPVTLTYYSSEAKTDPDYLFKQTIMIVPSSVSIAGITDDGGAILENDSTADIDLAGWKINSAGFQYVFPNYTIVPSSGKLFVSSHVIGFTIAPSSSVAIFNPDGVLISAFGQKTNAQTARASRTPDDQVLGIAKTADAAQMPISTIPITYQNALPQVISTKDFLNEHKKLFITVGIIAAIVLAYGGFRLYAIRNSDDLTDEELLDLDDADDFL